LDANHSYESVKEDIEAWFPKVKKGGLFAGHDYIHWAGVKKVVDEIFKKQVSLSRSSWLYFKK
jgi:Methyltransferase domain